MMRLIPLLAALGLVACAPAPDGAPRLLSQAEIAAATQGSASPPDNAALLARGARLQARAAALRRTTIDSLDDELRRRRARG
jgi:hypothetical protein